MTWIKERLAGLLNVRRWMFEWRYWRGQTPWDTETTPPEVQEYLATAEPGRALDLGCGTGTNAITLAQHGWQVVGIDFIPKAIRLGRRKAKRAGVTVDLRVGDVTDLREVAGPLDLALDIGCLFSLDPPGRRRYAAELARLIHPGGDYMLYAWLPRERNGELWGISQEQVANLFSESFEITRTEIGDEQGGGSAWYWMNRRRTPPSTRPQEQPHQPRPPRSG